MNDTGIFNRGGGLRTGLALLAALALVVGLAGVTAETGAGAGAAQTAAKGKKAKCKKKKGKKGSAAAKKGKCKKRKAKKPAPIVRASITWANGDADDADLDLFVFAAGGVKGQASANAIPKSSFTADATGRNGSETFTDLAPKPARAFSFGVCYQVGGSAHTPFTIKYVTADGQSHTQDIDPGSSFHYEFPGGVPIPEFCAD